MKLLVYEKFMDSFIELPKQVQKKVLTFQRKFRENSKSSGIHLEPISTFKDSSLRSARVDGTYRAIIKAPESGTTYYLLWIDHHDKAYAWAENKMFQWNKSTQVMQMFEASDDLLLEEEAANHKYDGGVLEKYSDEELERIGVPTVLLSSVRDIKSVSDLESMESYIPEDAFENLFYLLDGALIQALITEVEEGTISSESFDDQLASANNRRRFIELTDDALFNEVLEDDFEKWKYYLHPSQRKIVFKNNKGPVKVSGGAGTGKTVAALHRLKYIADTHPSKKILFTTYTKALTLNLKKLISRWNINTANIEISNIDQVAYTLAIQLGLVTEQTKVLQFHNSTYDPEKLFDDILLDNLSPFDSQFFLSEWRNVVLYHNVSSLADYYLTSRTGRTTAIGRRQKKHIWEVFDIYRQVLRDKKLIHMDQVYNLLVEKLNAGEGDTYQYVLVDELQDFSNVELRFVRALTAEKENDLFLVGDPLQKVYDKYINFSQAGINIRGRRSQRLRINYRTSEEIKKLALSAIQDVEFDDFDGEIEAKNGYVSIFHGREPEIKSFKSKDNEIQYIVTYMQDLLERPNTSQKDIVICCRTNNALKEIKKEIHLVDGLEYNESNGELVVGHAEGIQLLTMHSIKGLEFKHVIIADLGPKSFPLQGQFYNSFSEVQKEEFKKREKSLLYVAISRARETVLITGVGQVDF